MERLIDTIYTFDNHLEKIESEYIVKVQEKLKVYEDAEEQGLLLRLPVAKGNAIFQPIYSSISKIGGIEELEVVEISDSRIWAGCDCFDYDDLGRTLFLTHEEAEQALAEMKGA